VSREATTPGTARQTPRPTSARPGRRAARSRTFAGLVVLAHLLVAAHTVAHLYPPSFDETSQHCAICNIAKHPTSVATVVVASGQYTATWIAWCVSPPALTAQCSDRAIFARAPPVAARLVAIG
jgi:hypothetical protein